jgi:hypothetical protein
VHTAPGTLKKLEHPETAPRSNSLTPPSEYGTLMLFTLRKEWMVI